MEQDERWHLTIQVPDHQQAHDQVREVLHEALAQLEQALERLGVTSGYEWFIKTPKGYLIPSATDGRRWLSLGYGADAHPSMHDDYVDWTYADPDGRVGCATCDRQITQVQGVWQHVWNDSPRCHTQITDSPTAQPQDPAYYTDVAQ